MYIYRRIYIYMCIYISYIDIVYIHVCILIYTEVAVLMFYRHVNNNSEAVLEGKSGVPVDSAIPAVPLERAAPTGA